MARSLLWALFGLTIVVMLCSWLWGGRSGEEEIGDRDEDVETLLGPSLTEAIVAINKDTPFSLPPSDAPTEIQKRFSGVVDSIKRARTEKASAQSVRLLERDIGNLNQALATESLPYHVNSHVLLDGGKTKALAIAFRTQSTVGISVGNQKHTVNFVRRLDSLNWVTKSLGHATHTKLQVNLDRAEKFIIGEVLPSLTGAVSKDQTVFDGTCAVEALLKTELRKLSGKSPDKLIQGDEKALKKIQNAWKFSLARHEAQHGADIKNGLKLSETAGIWDAKRDGKLHPNAVLEASAYLAEIARGENLTAIQVGVLSAYLRHAPKTSAEYQSAVLVLRGIIKAARRRPPESTRQIRLSARIELCTPEIEQFRKRAMKAWEALFLSPLPKLRLL